MEALYLGIQKSWNFNFDIAKIIFNFFIDKGDIRHYLHQVELSIIKVLITGKKGLLDKSMVKIIKLEEFIG